MGRDSASENEVMVLHGLGWSNRRIARETGVSRNTVAAIVGRVLEAREKGHSALPRVVQRKSQLDPFGAFVAEQLDQYPDLTAVRLHEKLRGQGFTGGHTIVKDLLRRVRPEPKKEPVERFETAPGEQGQQDWSPYTLDFTGSGRQRVECFSFVLGFSRRHFMRFGERQDHYAMIRSHRAAAEKNGGMPATVLYDNQSTVVLRRETGRPIYQPRFLAFATHYGFRPQALPPRRPALKGKVERPFQYIEGNFLNGRTYRDLDDLNEQAAWWLDHVADLRVHGTTGERPIDRFEKEKDALQPLPRRPFDTAEVGYRVVSDDGFVRWDDTRYAVPWEHVLDLVVVRGTEDEIVVYGGDLREVARLERKPRGHVAPVGVDRYHPRRKGKRDLDVLVARMGELGEEGAAFAAGIGRGQRYWGQHLVEVLRLRERYDADDLAAALARAVRYRAYDAAVVTRILEAASEPRSLPDTLEEHARQRLRDSLAAEHVEPRPMSAYAAALRGEEARDDR